ncbi:MAG: MGMT family protein [Actinomycetota bacterium]
MNERPDRRVAELLDVLIALEPGEVTTYGDVAATAGHQRQARLVGRVLGDFVEWRGVEVPWWRVVNAAGQIRTAPHGRQAELLRSEGVVVRDGRVRAAPIGRFCRDPS